MVDALRSQRLLALLPQAQSSPGIPHDARSPALFRLTPALAFIANRARHASSPFGWFLRLPDPATGGGRLCHLIPSTSI